MRLKVASVSPVLVALLFVACGGAAQSDLFGGGGGAGSQDSGGAADTGSSGVDSGNGAGDASTGTDAGHHRDAGGPPVDAGEPPDTGVIGVDSGAGDPGIYCGKGSQGDIYCPVGQDDCCITAQGTSAITYACEAVGALTCLGVAAMCDDTADCGNKMCCGTFDSASSRYREVTCRSSCSGQGPNGTVYRRFCDPFLQPSDCPQGQACQASQVLTGYYVCL